MAYLFWKDGRMQCPPCSACGSTITDEEQDIVRPHEEEPKIRVISVKCAAPGCGHIERLGTYRHLGGHNFERIGD